ncbi:hypothetical protein GCM10027612_16150 [Microbispora bryophytorum subsp. camponoti]
MRRFTLCLPALGVFIALGATACDGGTDSKQTTDPAHQRKAAIVKAVQCLLDRDAIPEEQLRSATWLKEGKLLPNADFTDWYTTHDNVKYQGQTLVEWTEQAEKAGNTWRCSR